MNKNWKHIQFGDGTANFHWLHGWGHNKSALKRMAELFKNSGSHTLYDLPGFGESDMLHEGAGTHDYAKAFISQLKNETDNILVGHSYGGRVAIQCAARYPDTVKAIILIGGAGLQRKRSLGFKLKAFTLRTLGRLARLSDKIINTDLHKAYREKFGSSDYQKAGALRSTLVKAVTEDLSPQAMKVKCPVLLIYGSEDTETPPEIGRKYENLIPIARYEELKGYGHNDILTRGAYQCEALMRTFLKDLGDD